MPNQTLAQIKEKSGLSQFAKGEKVGKTAREHANGKWARRLTNHETRKAWDRTINERGKGRPDFPTEVCNGRDTVALRGKVKYVNGGPVPCSPRGKHRKEKKT